MSLNLPPIIDPVGNSLSSLYAPVDRAINPIATFAGHVLRKMNLTVVPLQRTLVNSSLLQNTANDQLVEVEKYLTDQELGRLKCCAKKFRDINDDHLWKAKYLAKRKSDPFFIDLSPDASFRKSYILAAFISRSIHSFKVHKEDRYQLTQVTDVQISFEDFVDTFCNVKVRKDKNRLLVVKFKGVVESEQDRRAIGIFIAINENQNFKIGFNIHGQGTSLIWMIDRSNTNISIMTGSPEAEREAYLGDARKILKDEVQSEGGPIKPFTPIMVGLAAIVTQCALNFLRS